MQNRLSLGDILECEKVINIKKREFSNFSNTSNSVLLLTEVHYFHMNRQEPKQKGLSESRFGTIIFLLRIAGIPCKMKKISTIFFIYMITVIICATTSYLGMFVDVFVHRDVLGRAMTNMRMLISFTDVIWLFSICR
jgi:hypothetical protein